MMNYYIFGAHSRGRTVKEYLRVLHPDMELLAYLYDNDEKNPKEVDGVPVNRVSEHYEIINQNPMTQVYLKRDFDVACPVYIGTRGVSHPHIIEVLKSIGFTDIRPVTVQLDISMRNEYVENVFKEKRLSFRKMQVGNTINKEATRENNQSNQQPTIVDKGTVVSCGIYVAKSANDKKLSVDWIPDAYEKILQVGCSLTQERIPGATFFDYEGENISDRNRQFCELTGLYWIWKHATQDVVGLVHYRRHFLLPIDWKRYFAADSEMLGTEAADPMTSSTESTDVVMSGTEAADRGILDDIASDSLSSYNKKADVFLPVPLYVAPSLAGNFRDRHVPAVWEAMMEALAEGDAEEAKRAETFFETNGLYCPCNMLITRREILSKLCEWLFPILFKVQARIGMLSDPYQNRYPGFLSERLITFWFYDHRDKYRIWFADKNFLQ